ncbi:MAG: ABC transporter permease [Candidatus Heimdallarchaeota archaeon]|nr:ABC transporter permease [Candidatus Heimdallarchaeota archaeon]
MFWHIVGKFSKEFRRNKISVGLVFIFPIFFLTIFNIAFGGVNFTGTNSYSIAVFNHDQGVPESVYNVLNGSGFPQNWLDDGVGKNLTDILFSAEYDQEDNETQYIFNRVNLTEPEIEDFIAEGEVSLVLIIPENFSLSVLNLINNNILLENGFVIPGVDNVNASFEIYGDERSTSFVIANSIIQSIINTFIERIEIGDYYNSGQVTILQESILPEDEEFSLFAYIAPGIFVFSTIMSASYFSALLLIDEEKDLMSRYKISLVSPRMYLLAFTLFSFAIMMVQAGLLLLAAKYIFGFDPVGSMINAFWVLLMLAMGVFGLIFTAAAFFNSSDSAGSSIGSTSAVVGFASGSFMPMPDFIIAKDVMTFTSGSPHLLIWDILPWTHANNAIRQILLFDTPLNDLTGDLILLNSMGLIWMILGIFVFSKRRFVGEK